VPPRVTYWTGTWDPAREAISKEIESLRIGRRARAPVVSFAPRQRLRVAWGSRVLVLPARHWMALRAVAALLEPFGDVTHVFGGQVSWHLLRALGRRPVILTAVVPPSGDGAVPTSRLAAVAVESKGSVDEWIRVGVPPERIEVIYPGIDLNWMRPLPPPAAARPALLFASTPADVADLEPRGVPLLVELARRRADIDVLVPWRAWGDLDAARRAVAALRPPRNFIISFGDCADMREQYARAWATIACFAPGTGKTCPNFVLEGLASRRPAILTPSVGIAAEVAGNGAGVVTDRTVSALDAAIDVLRADWTGYADRARALAERAFDLRLFHDRYHALYETASAAAK
jgi:glycosyltransferase involved in cell wall biosynthesis